MKIIKYILLAVSLLLHACDNAQLPEADDSISKSDTSGSPQTSVTYTGNEEQKLQKVLSEIPEVEAPILDRSYATALAALPLSCLDRPQKQSDYKGYLYERTVQLRSQYQDSLSFYGCYDWHSSVNSTWAMVRVYKEYPDMVLGGLIDEKLNNHLSEESLKGELNFFKNIAKGSFERPYGWAWYLYLHAELSDWETEDAQKWSSAMEPLASYFSEKMISYLDKLDYPLRVGTHSSTAFSLSMMRKYAVSQAVNKLKDAIDKHSRRFFLNDKNCPAAYEPSGSDFLSPCLTEAELMSFVLAPGEFKQWLDSFMPKLYSSEFLALKQPPDIIFEKEKLDGENKTSEKKNNSTDEGDEDDMLGAKSHLIGLAFHRASAFNRIAAVLPENDIRSQIYQKLADLHGKRGFDTMYKADYLGTHWLGTYAVLYLQSQRKEN